jgi:uncharacterized protein YggE
MKTNLLPILLVALAAPASAQFLPRPAGPETFNPPLVTVQGRGEVRVPNTVAVVHLGFEAAGTEEAEVRRDITTRSQATVEALRAEESVSRLQTTAVNIRPQFSHQTPQAGRPPAPPAITGYTGQVGISFEAPVEESGRLISAMLEHGANAVTHVLTRPGDEARRAAEDEALTLAAQDAEAQARALLEAVDLRWVGVRTMDATGGRMDPGPFPRSAAMAMTADAAPLPDLDIAGGETVVIREVVMQVDFRSP